MPRRTLRSRRQMGHTLDTRTICSVGRQLARIGDEVNRRYCDDVIEEIEAVLQARRLRRRKTIKRIATIILQGGGINVGVFAVVHFWLGYHGQA